MWDFRVGPWAPATSSSPMGCRDKQSTVQGFTTRGVFLGEGREASFTYYDLPSDTQQHIRFQLFNIFSGNYERPHIHWPAPLLFQTAAKISFSSWEKAFFSSKTIKCTPSPVRYARILECVEAGARETRRMTASAPSAE